MTIRLAAWLAVSMTVLVFGGPALAQAPDFGSDTSPWANDGECDDPRFTGPGMAATAQETDRMADATDCQAAFQAGTVQLSQGQAAEPAAPVASTTSPDSAAPVPGAKRVPVTSPAAPVEPAAPPAQVAGLEGTLATPPALTAQSTPTAQINFGDDSAPWPNDGECDDRRFAGEGMAASALTWQGVGGDASDCRALYEAGSIRLWSQAESQAATQCAALDYGDNQSQYASDGECDDMRFEGLGVAGILNATEIGHDSADCSRLCAFGAISVRDY